MKRALALIAVPAALAVSLAACGGGDDPASGGPMTGHSMSTSTGGGQAAQHNEQDVMFAQMMIPHHRQAIEMAALAATRASSAEVKSLATGIEKAQGPEIQQMSGWLTAWGASVPSPGMGGMEHDMGGMMSEKDVRELKAAKGTAFDRSFLRMMIKHHEGAVATARTEQSAGRFPEATSMAARIVTAQSAEITKMQGMLRKE